MEARITHLNQISLFLYANLVITQKYKNLDN